MVYFGIRCRRRTRDLDSSSYTLGSYRFPLRTAFTVVTLFLVGSGLSRQALKAVGRRPIIQGFLLWVVMGAGTLGAILLGWIA
jgi:hypothetical protein